VCLVSWLTDPDEEWSTDERSTRRGHPQTPEPDPAAAGMPWPPTGEPVRPMYPDYQGEWGGGPVDPAVAPVGPPPGNGSGERHPGRLKLVAIILTGWLVVSAVVLVTLLLVRGPHNSAGPAGPTSTAGGSSAQSNPPSSSLPDGWTQQATDDQTDCAAHAYGQVQAFLAKTRCSSVHRVLATTNQGGRPVVVAAYTITFDSASRAASYNKLVASDGTGNISDLLRDGTTYPGAPRALPPAGFASRVEGIQVFVAEAGYTTGASRSDDPSLRSVAQQAVARR
jgi:hypothetical protein